MQADGRLIERAAGLQVLYVEHDVARADDVEGRIEDVCWNGHSASSCHSGAVRRTEPGISRFSGAQLRTIVRAARAPERRVLHSQSLNPVRAPRQRDMLGF